MRILVVEDDPKTAGFLRCGLEAAGYVVDVAATGPDAVQRATTSTYDLSILDLMLPGFDGHEVLRRLRAAGVRTPVLVVTARGAVEERVRGLDEGADDYLTKPFSFAELLARVRAIQRRVDLAFDPLVHAGDVVIDTMKREATFQGRILDLTPREYQLLERLVRRPGVVQSRAMLADGVWGSSLDPASNVIDVYINYLRKKIAAVDGGAPIRTVRGAGYVFDVPGPDAP